MDDISCFSFSDGYSSIGRDRERGGVVFVVEEEGWGVVCLVIRFAKPRHAEPQALSRGEKRV